MNQHYCCYYQAHVGAEHCWLVVATLRSFEHMVLDRTIDKENSILEFFVSPEMENLFVQVMQICILQDLVRNFKRLPNRYMREQVV